MTGVLNGLSFVRGLRELVQAIFRCGHLIGDAIVQGSATSHMVPVEKGEGASVRTNTHTHTDTHSCLDYYVPWCLIIVLWYEILVVLWSLHTEMTKLFYKITKRSTYFTKQVLLACFRYAHLQSQGSSLDRTELWLWTSSIHVDLILKIKCFSLFTLFFLNVFKKQFKLHTFVFSGS